MSTEFKREERYIVIKRSDLDHDENDAVTILIAELCLPLRNFLVIESDWPEYEPAWSMIERRMTGQPAVTAAEELDAVLHWRGKHTQAIRERDALQLRLNAADERADVLYGTCVEQDGLLREWLNDFGRTHSGLQRLKERTRAALKPAEPDRIKGMIEAAGGEYAIMIDPENGHFGWTFKRHPDGQWVSGRKATEPEMQAARQCAVARGQNV